MAVEYIDSCGDHLSASQQGLKWDIFQDTDITASGYNGTKALDSGISAYTRVRCVKAVTLVPANTVVYGFRVYFGPGAFPLGSIFSVWVLSAIHYRGGSGGFNEGTKQLSLNIANDGKVYIARGGWAGTVLGTSSAVVFGNDAWHYVEVEALISSTVGTVIVRVGNTIVLSLSGQNTQALGAANIDAVEFIPWRIDDIYILSKSGGWNTSFLGKGFHVLANPMASDSSVQWTPPLGLTNVQGINPANPDGSYNSTASVGAADVFTPTALSSAVKRIHAIQGNHIAYGSGVPIPQLADVVDVEGVRYEGSSVNLGGLRDYRTIRELNPQSGVVWTRVSYNASKRGYKRVA